MTGAHVVGPWLAVLSTLAFLLVASRATAAPTLQAPAGGHAITIPDGEPGSPFGFVFGPSISIGNIGANL